MIAVLGLSISMMMPRISPVDLHLPVARQDDILDKIIPRIDIKDVPLHVVLKRIFTEVKAKYSVESAIDQNLLVSAHFVNAKFEVVLIQILNQHGFSFRYMDNSFVIIDRSDPDLSNPEFANDAISFAAAQAILDKIIPSFECKSVTARAAVEKLFAGTGQALWMNPLIDLKGKITVINENLSREKILQNILNRVGFTYRYQDKTFALIPRETGGEFGSEVPMPEFEPKGWTSMFVITNSSLFMSPKRTKSGTYQLLMEAVHGSGHWSADAWFYGSSGFAVSLPLESIDMAGKAIPSNSEFFSLDYLTSFGIAKLPELFATGFGNRDKDYRLISFTFATDLHVIFGVHKRDREYGSTSLPYTFGLEKWKKTPTVTAYVYEFRRQKGSRLATLLKPGQSKISARRHLVLAGLWTEKELGR